MVSPGWYLYPPPEVSWIADWPVRSLSFTSRVGKGSDQGGQHVSIPQVLKSISGTAGSVPEVSTDPPTTVDDRNPTRPNTCYTTIISRVFFFRYLKSCRISIISRRCSARNELEEVERRVCPNLSSSRNAFQADLGSCLPLMIEILHSRMALYQNPRNHSNVVYIWSCRTSITNSSTVSFGSCALASFAGCG